MVEECLSFGDEFAADGCAASADGADHFGVVVVEGDYDGGFGLAPDDGTHEFHRFFSCFGETFGADLDGAVVVDVDRTAGYNIPFVPGVKDDLAVLLRKIFIALFIDGFEDEVDCGSGWEVSSGGVNAPDEFAVDERLGAFGEVEVVVLTSGDRAGIKADSHVVDFDIGFERGVEADVFGEVAFKTSVEETNGRFLRGCRLIVGERG